MKSNVWIVTITAMEVDVKFLTITVAVEVKRITGHVKEGEYTGTDGPLDL